MKNSGRSIFPIGTLFLVCLAFPADTVAQAKKDPFARWEKSVQAYEKMDRTEAPPRGGIVFVGSSSIRLWDLKKHFPGSKVVNRGFGGSQMADAVHFLDRLVIKHAPRVVVLYSGDNDIGSGKSPEVILADFRELVRRLQKSMPTTKLIVLAIKPSGSRWKLFSRMQEANRLLAQECKKDERLIFVDVVPPMLGADGTPREELFRKDRLHLNEAGYEIWTDLVRMALKAAGEN